MDVNGAFNGFCFFNIACSNFITSYWLEMDIWFSSDRNISYNNFRDKKVDFHSLSSYDYLLEQALEIKYISDDEFKILKTWKKNPNEWSI